MNQLGARVAECRRCLDLTQDALCAIVARVTDGGWIPSRRDVFRIEAGLRIVSDLEILALAEAFECSPCWLLTGKADQC